jgi:septal ring factor EnvC (AmiA/AmiB activator)
MNNKTRKDLREIAGKMDELAGMLEDIKSQLEDIQEQEQEKYNNLPEQLQDTKKGCALYESAESLCELVDRLDTLLSDLWEISSDVEHATEN